MLIVVSGTSGSGKNTVINEIIAKNPNVKIMKSYTTRPPRGENDNAYHFVSIKELEGKIKRNEMFEVEEVHKGTFYGISKESLENTKNGIYIKDVDVNGSMKLKKYLGDGAKLVYLDVDKNELIERLKVRGENEESIKLRISRYEYEKTFAKNYDLVILNNDLDKTVNLIMKIFNI